MEVPTLLVAIPVLGQHRLTHQLLDDLARQQFQSFDVLVVDNGGDYPRLGSERVLRPGRNLGWAGGSNRGFREGFTAGYSHVMTLNNDTRLSPDFITGIMDKRLPDDAGIVGPVYDDKCPHQRCDHEGSAAEYSGAEYVRRVPFVDGTSLTLTHAAWLAVGDLDIRSFGNYSWGADLDLCFRVRRAGFACYVAESSFMNHLGRKTADAVAGKHRYRRTASVQRNRGIRRHYRRAEWAALCNEAVVRTALEAAQPGRHWHTAARSATG